MIKTKASKPILFLVFVVLALIFLTFFSLNFTPPTVSFVNPQAGNINVLDSTPVKLTFSKTLTPAQLKNLTLTISPDTSLALVWTETLLTATPTKPLLPHTLYTITLSYRNKPIFTSSFTTNLYSTKDLKTQAAQQILDDKIQGDVEKSYYQEKPWLRALPLETSTYRVIFDYETNKLRIRLLNGSSQEILPQILESLKSRQIDAAAIGYNLVQ